MEIWKVMPKEEYERLMTLNPDKPDLSLIVSLLTHQHQYRAKSIISILQQCPDFSWNKDGEITFKNKTAPQSHIFDLITFATKSVKSVNIPGIDLFISALRETNVPLDLLSPQAKQMLLPNKPSSKDNWIKFKN